MSEAKLFDRVQETTATTGTAALVLDGAQTGYRAFGDVLAHGDLAPYVVVTTGGQWEIGKGTYNASTNALARTTILASSNGGLIVSLSAGIKDVFLDLPSSFISLTATAYGIPRAGASGLLDIGWLPTGSTASTVCLGNDARLADARTPTAHATSHQHGGSDPVAVATPAANAIPKAGSGGTLALGWLPDLSSLYDAAGLAAAALVTAEAYTDTVAATKQPLDADLTAIAALTVARGTILVGNATPAWSTKAVGTNLQVLSTDGSDLVWTSSSGTGSIVRVTSPTLVTPTLGAATVTTVNKVTITQPATGATLTIQDGFTLTVSANATLSGTNTGDQTITLTGDVTGSGTGSFAATIANDAVTYAKMQNVSATSRVLGRRTAGAGDTEECTASQVLDFLGSTRGMVLYRGSSAWSALGTGTDGYVLTTHGAGADPTWAAVGSSSSPLTTKGDLWGYDSADARIPVGTDGYVLTADSGNSLGVSWQAGGSPVGSALLSGKIWVGNGSDQAAAVPVSADATLANTGALTVVATHAANTALKVLDTDASNYLTLKPGSDLSADRTLTIATGDSDRTLTLAGNATISGTSSGTNTGDQTSVTGNAGTVTVADAGGDTTTWVLLGTSQTGNLAPATDAGLTYNATTDALAATTFIGALTGNASTATALATARTINGVSFDGTANITVTAAAGTLTGTTLNATVVASSLTSVGTLTGGATGAGFTVALGTSTITGILGSANGGTANGFTKFTGPASTEKTFTLPNASAVVLTDNAVVTVAQGGTGAGTFTAHGIILGEGTSALAVTAAMTDGQLLVGQTGADPLPKTLSSDATLAASGALTIAADAVTYAKMQNVSATSRVLGRRTAGAGDPEECTASQILDFLSTTRGTILYRGSSAWSALGVGTDGYVLTTHSTGADPTWEAAGSGSSPLTTKGDVWGYSTVDARVPVGADGKVLTADSGAALGVSWQTPGAGASAPTGTIVATARRTAPSGWLSCDASSVSRVTYADLFDAITFTQDCTTSNGSTTLTVEDSNVIRPLQAVSGANSGGTNSSGCGVSGTGIPLNTRVVAILSSTTVQLSIAATADGSPTLTFLPFGPGSGSDAEFTLPALNNTDYTVPVGVGNPARDVGQSGGSATYTLDTSEIPDVTVTDPGHTHTVTDPGHTHTVSIDNSGISIIAGSASLQGTADAAGASFISDSNTTGASVNSNTTGITVAGGGSAHSIVQPYLAVLWIIKT